MTGWDDYLPPGVTHADLPGNEPDVCPDCEGDGCVWCEEEAPDPDDRDEDDSW